MGRISDTELVVKAQKGDVDAFAALAERYQLKIYRTLLALTGSPMDADDLAQEAFMKAYQSLGRFKRKAGFYTWVYRIAFNLAMNMLKRKNLAKDRLTAIPMEPGMEGVLGGSQDLPEKQSLRNELRVRLKEAVGSLPLIYRASFILVALEGMSHMQAAEVLKCSENTVSWRMHKARKMLQERLRPYLGDRP
jgi:RNA polymerase sigma-70 factor (ECF subfamily)